MKRTIDFLSNRAQSKYFYSLNFYKIIVIWQTKALSQSSVEIEAGERQSCVVQYRIFSISSRLLSMSTNLNATSRQFSWWLGRGGSSLRQLASMHTMSLCCCRTYSWLSRSSLVKMRNISNFIEDSTDSIKKILKYIPMHWIWLPVEYKIRGICQVMFYYLPASIFDRIVQQELSQCFLLPPCSSIYPDRLSSAHITISEALATKATYSMRAVFAAWLIYVSCMSNYLIFWQVWPYQDRRHLSNYSQMRMRLALGNYSKCISSLIFCKSILFGRELYSQMFLMIAAKKAGTFYGTIAVRWNSRLRDESISMTSLKMGQRC